MRKLFAVLLLVAAVVAGANETSIHTIQSGSQYGPTPLFDHGIHGEGQILAVLDTGVDYTNCYFAEANGAMPPLNTWANGALQWTNVDLTRRKIVAYDFLYSCDQFPTSPYCDDPKSGLNAFDNQGHGTHAAASAVADKAPFIAHDFADAIAPGAKLVVQDAGLSPTDLCTSRPGIGCPVTMLPILDQAYRQGARIHSNSWGDRQGVPPSFPPPTANYTAAARDIDSFVASHADMLVVFNTGNNGSTAAAPAGSLSAPGCAKNTIQVGGTRWGYGGADDYLAQLTLIGPSRDGRIKPDLVGPAEVLAADAHAFINSDCATSTQPGTSFASPTIAGAAALVRQYYTDGFYPTGVATPSNVFTPSAALLKATLIAAAHRVPYKVTPNGQIVSTDPVPNYEQGFGFPILGDVLYFPGNTARLRVLDETVGLSTSQSYATSLHVNAGTPLKIALVWSDPAGVPRNDATPQLVNDLDLSVTAPDGTTLFGNERLHPGQPDRVNNVEAVKLDTPAAGTYTVRVTASRIASGNRQPYALVISADATEEKVQPSRVRAVRH